MKPLNFCLLFLLFSFSFICKAEEAQGDSKLRISILTCDPDDSEPYALFGHAAIRIIDHEFGADQAFNYGIFDFESPNFTYRFARGKAFHILGVNQTDAFIRSYKRRGSKIVEQVLNLTNEEKNVMRKKLYNNALPENRTYLYNFFYNNCSTKCFDILEQCIAGVITDTGKGRNLSFRQLVRNCTEPQPWTKFGCDLALGKPADKKASVREQTFLPLLLREQLEQAQILNEKGDKRPLVSQTNILFEGYPTNKSSKSSYPPPIIVFLILLVSTLIITILEKKQKIKLIPKLFDTLLFLISGIGGCVLFFLGFFSIHPATNPNYLLLILHPLWLFFAIGVWIKTKSTLRLYIHFITFVAILGILLVGVLSIQVLPTEAYLIGLTLMIRNMMRIKQQMSISKNK